MQWREEEPEWNIGRGEWQGLLRLSSEDMCSQIFLWHLTPSEIGMGKRYTMGYIFSSIYFLWAPSFPCRGHLSFLQSARAFYFGEVNIQQARAASKSRWGRVALQCPLLFPGSYHLSCLLLPFLRRILTQGLALSPLLRWLISFLKHNLFAFFLFLCLTP